MANTKLGSCTIFLCHFLSLYTEIKPREYIRIVDEIELNSEKPGNDADYVARNALFIFIYLFHSDNRTYTHTFKSKL